MTDEMDFSDLPKDHYPDLMLTGERTLPGVREENYWFQRHLVAYEYLLGHVRGKRVLDLGSGEGYGTDLLATQAAQAIGVDLAPEAVYHARNTYRRENLSFVYGDIYRLQFQDESFDVVCSLQVLEHLREPELFMAEARRVLRPGGRCFITTPNRLVISPGSDKPVNPFHIFEFDDREFMDFMGRFFEEVEVLGVFHARKLLLHDRLTRTDFSRFCLALSARRARLFYNPFFIPSIKTGDFAIKPGPLEGALDFLAVARKPAGGGV